MKSVRIMPESIARFLMLNAGILIIALGDHFFKFPNNFSMGGVAGIAVVVSKLIPALSSSVITSILNIVLLIVGFMVFGRSFGFMTAYASVALSGFLLILDKVVPMTAPFTQEPMLEMIFAVLLPAIGAAILFNIGASSGGTDVIAMILKKHTNLNIGNALLISDSIFAVASCFVFGMQTGLISIVGLVAKALVVDTVIENINLCKYFTIVTTKPQEVENYIIKFLNRSATVMDGSGAFSNEKKAVMLCVVNRPQAILLRNYIKQIDPQSFLLITNTSQIVGKGFRSAA